MNENIQARVTGPLWGESTGERWITPPAGPVMRKPFAFDNFIMFSLSNKRPLFHIKEDISFAYSSAMLSVSFWWDINRFRMMYIHKLCEIESLSFTCSCASPT